MKLNRYYSLWLGAVISRYYVLLDSTLNWAISFPKNLPRVAINSMKYLEVYYVLDKFKYYLVDLPIPLKFEVS